VNPTQLKGTGSFPCVKSGRSPKHTTYLHSLTVIFSQTTIYNINYALQRHFSTQMIHRQATFKTIFKVYKVTVHISSYGGLEDACWPLGLKFAGSNPAEAVGFFRAKKSPAFLPSEGK
jgi:hypothetical protein